MGYLVFLLAAALETCPVEGWDWDLGLFWIGFLFILLVQVSVDVTRASGRRRPPG